MNQQFPQAARFPLTDFGFDDMRLQVGERVQIELRPAHDHEHHFTTLIGYLKGHSLLVKTPIVNGLPLPVTDGAMVEVRAFSGSTVFTFQCEVLRVCVSPFAYLHLSFPTLIRGAVIRKSERVRVNIPARVASMKKGEHEEWLPASIANIGTGGALIESRHELGDPNEVIRAAFSFNVEPDDYEASMSVQAIIHKVTRAIVPDAAERTVIYYGVQFRDLRPGQSVVLQNLVDQHLIGTSANLA
jgi:c-di-GMP-binding flagellar brake protein YcgR